MKKPKYYASKQTSKQVPQNSALAADVSFLALMLLLFLSTVVIVLHPESVLQNVITLFVIFVVLLITSFTTLTTGLILNLILIFGYGSYLLYTLAVLGASYETVTYAWMILSLLMTTATGILFRGMRGIEAQFESMRRQVAEQVTIDEVTGLKTRFAFQQELQGYQSMARRYEMQLLLIVWEFRFYSEMQRYLGKEKLRDVAVVLSQEMRQIFRNEDAVYLVHQNPYRWALLILVQPDSEAVIIQRMKGKIESMNLTETLGEKIPKLEIRTGTMVDSQLDLTAEELLNSAVSHMQYDV